MIILCLALMVGFAVAIPWAIRNDRADHVAMWGRAHLLHEVHGGERWPGMREADDRCQRIGSPVKIL